MTLTGKVHISFTFQLAPKNVVHHVTCHQDSRSGPILLNEKFLRAYWMPQIIESTTKPLFSASKTALTVFEHISLYLHIENKNTITLS